MYFDSQAVVAFTTCLAKGDNKMEEEIMRPSRPTSEPELFSFYASFCCEDTVCLEKAQGYHNKA